jgi:hypothetical protein
MPRTPIDYSKTIIYKLVHKDDYDNVNIYVGSTTDYKKRKSDHKKSCNNDKHKDHNAKKSQYIRDNGGWVEWLMIEIEKYPCNDGNEARAREEYWKCYYNATLNTNKAYRTDIEKNHIPRYIHEYYRNNTIEEIQEYYQQYKVLNQQYLQQQKDLNQQ